MSLNYMQNEADVITNIIIYLNQLISRIHVLI